MKVVLLDLEPALKLAERGPFAPSRRPGERKLGGEAPPASPWLRGRDWVAAGPYVLRPSAAPGLPCALHTDLALPWGPQGPDLLCKFRSLWGAVCLFLAGGGVGVPHLGLAGFCL